MVYVIKRRLNESLLILFVSLRSSAQARKYAMPMCGERFLFRKLKNEL